MNNEKSQIIWVKEFQIVPQIATTTTRVVKPSRGGGMWNLLCGINKQNKRWILKSLPLSNYSIWRCERSRTIWDSHANRKRISLREHVQRTNDISFNAPRLKSKRCLRFVIPAHNEGRACWSALRCVVTTHAAYRKRVIFSRPFFSQLIKFGMLR